MKTNFYLLVLLTISQIFVSSVTAQEDQKAELVVQIGHSQIAGPSAFSPDGRYIVTGDTQTGSMILWEVRSGKEIRRFVGHEAGISSVEFSLDSRQITSSSKDQTTRVWDVVTAKEQSSVSIHNSNLTKGLFSHDKRFRAWATEDELIKWDVELNRESFRIKLPAEVKGIEKTVSRATNTAVLGFSVGDKYILTSTQIMIGPDENETRGQNIFQSVSIRRTETGPGFTVFSMQIWEAQTGVLLRNETLTSVLAVSPDGLYAFVQQFSTEPKTPPRFRVWNLSEMRPIYSIEDDARMVTLIDNFEFINNGKTLRGWGVDEKNLQVIDWDANTGQLLKLRPAVPAKSGGNVVSVRRRNGEIGEVYFHNCSGDHEENNPQYNICSVDFEDGYQSEIVLKRFMGYSNRFSSPVVSKDGSFVAFGATDSTTTIVDARTNLVVSWLTGKVPSVTAVAVDHQGKTLITQAENDTVIQWNLEQGVSKVEKLGTRNVGETDCGREPIDVTSGDGLVKLLQPKPGEEVTLVDTATGKPIKTLFEGYICSLGVSHDGKSVAIGFYGGTIRVWQFDRGSEGTRTRESTLIGHSSMVRGLAFMPDGKTLVSAGWDSTTRLWDVETGREKAKLITDFDGGWAVVTPEGLFDASPEGRKNMHYSLGMEIFSLDQMKDSYYVPGLLSKIMKGDPLPKVELFSKKDLFPDVEFEQPKPGQTAVQITVTNRGGGIGPVQVLINGIELVADARPSNFDPQTKTPVTLHSFRVRRTGSRSLLETSQVH
jgi:WD40 repeat protein